MMFLFVLLLCFVLCQISALPQAELDWLQSHATIENTQLRARLRSEFAVAGGTDLALFRSWYDYYKANGEITYPTYQTTTDYTEKVSFLASKVAVMNAGYTYRQFDWFFWNVFHKATGSTSLSEWLTDKSHADAIKYEQKKSVAVSAGISSEDFYHFWLFAYSTSADITFESWQGTPQYAKYASGKTLKTELARRGYSESTYFRHCSTWMEAATPEDKTTVTSDSTCSSAGGSGYSHCSASNTNYCCGACHGIATCSSNSGLQHCACTASDAWFSSEDFLDTKAKEDKRKECIAAGYKDKKEFELFWSWLNAPAPAAASVASTPGVVGPLVLAESEMSSATFTSGFQLTTGPGCAPEEFYSCTGSSGHSVVSFPGNGLAKPKELRVTMELGWHSTTSFSVNGGAFSQILTDQHQCYSNPTDAFVQFFIPVSSWNVDGTNTLTIQDDNGFCLVYNHMVGQGALFDGKYIVIEAVV
jgi:hypothetical protein